MTSNKIRVRFAPSPTGPLHIGGVRTALYNYLFAKKNNGDFILRIEDTDQNRFVSGAEEYIIDTLKWCSIEPTEGVGIGGNYGPYRQSERKEIYKKYVNKLVIEGKAYFAFDTPEELETMRTRLKNSGSSNQQYNAETRTNMNNSFTLSEKELSNKITSGDPYVIRLNVPLNEKIIFNDSILGKISFSTDQLDDKILFKSDGMPTYHLANVVDDHLMKISHVIRGSEWVNSTPSHVLLYQYFGWQEPVFAHMPLILKPSGKGKLSKRDGLIGGFPVFPLEWKKPESNEIFSGYRESGYFPEAFLNILAFLGWNPGTNQEIFSLQQLIQSFSLQNVGKSGARFDPEKARWYNHHYLQKISDKELSQLFLFELKSKNIESNLDFLLKIIPLIKERANFITEFWNLSCYFFQAPDFYDESSLKKIWDAQIFKLFNSFIPYLNNINNFSVENVENIIKSYILQKNLHMGKFLNLLRLLIVGSLTGPSIFVIISLIGKEETIFRLKKGLSRIKL